MKLLKKTISVVLAAALSITVPYNASAAERVEMVLNYDGQDHFYDAEAVNLMVNGVEMDYLPMPPVIIDNYTLVPVKEVFEALGAVVDWKPDTKEVYIGYNNILVILQIGNPYANVNGRQMVVGTPPKIINDKTMVPLRFAGESVGLKVDWKGESRTAYIGEAVASQPVVPDAHASGSNPVVPDAYASGSNPVVPDLPVAGSGSGEAPVISIPPTEMSAAQTSQQTSQTSVVTPQLELGKDVSPGEITAEKYELVSIEQLQIPGSNDAHTIKIIASGPISKVDKMLMPDNRLVVDIVNAEMKLTQDKYVVENSPAFKQIRTSQFQLEPEKISRFVFDMIAPADYSITLSADRRTVLVDFQKNAVTDIRFNSDGAADYIYIEGLTAPATNIFPLTNPDRIVVDIPYSELRRPMNLPTYGAFLSSIRASQFDANTSRIVLDLKAQAKYDVTVSGKQVIIKLTTPTYKNIRYDGAARKLTISKASGISINLDAIGHNDQYNQYKYTLTLPGDYSGALGYGEYVVRDSYLYSIMLQTNGGNTELVFNERQVLAYSVSEDAENIYVHVLLPREKYSRIVVIDPGHGGEKAPGTIHNGMVEKNLTLDYGLKLIQLIERDGRIKVYSTRTADVNPSFDERSDMGNVVGDIFVSIHINAADKNTTANGAEVHYYPHDNDAALGFSTKDMAEIMVKNIVAGTGANDRKTKSSPYLVIKNTEVPSVLCEMGFLTNPAEAALMATDDYRQKGAEAIYRGILEVFETYTPRR